MHTGQSIKVFFAAILLFHMLGINAAEAERLGIAAVVNDDVITFADVDNRLNLYALGQKPPEGDARASAEHQVLDKLIDEKLQMQEAKDLEIAVTDQQMKEAFASVADKNHLSADEFRQRISAGGVKVDTLYDQIRADIAWGQVIRRRLRPQVRISDTDIDNEIDAMARVPQPVAPVTAPSELIKQPVLHLKQIVIPILEHDPEAIIQAKISRAESLKSEITSCDAMDVKMKDFLSNGTGDLGDVPLSNLPDPVRAAVENLGNNALSTPIRAQNGVVVVMICDRKIAEAPASATQIPQPAPKVVDKNDAGIRDQVANKLGSTRLLQMADRYLRDLRASAFIDKKI